MSLRLSTIICGQVYAEVIYILWFKFGLLYVFGNFFILELSFFLQCNFSKYFLAHLWIPPTSVVVVPFHLWFYNFSLYCFHCSVRLKVCQSCFLNLSKELTVSLYTLISISLISNWALFFLGVYRVQALLLFDFLRPWDTSWDYLFGSSDFIIFVTYLWAYKHS